MISELLKMLGNNRTLQTLSSEHRSHCL